MVGNDANVAVFDFPDEILELSRPEIMNGLFQPFVLDRAHDAIEERRTWAVNAEFCGWKRLANERERLDSKVQPVPFHQGPVIHNHERLVARLASRDERRGGAKRKNLAVRRIHDHFNLLWTATARGEDSLKCHTDSYDGICAGDAPLLNSPQEPDAQAVFLELENR